jgi:hypothetical protein
MSEKWQHLFRPFPSLSPSPILSHLSLPHSLLPNSSVFYFYIFLSVFLYLPIYPCIYPLFLLLSPSLSFFPYSFVFSLYIFLSVFLYFPLCLSIPPSLSMYPYPSFSFYIPSLSLSHFLSPPLFFSLSIV